MPVTIRAEMDAVYDNVREASVAQSAAINQVSDWLKRAGYTHDIIVKNVRIYDAAQMGVVAFACNWKDEEHRLVIEWSINHAHVTVPTLRIDAVAADVVTALRNALPHLPARVFDAIGR